LISPSHLLNFRIPHSVQVDNSEISETSNAMPSAPSALPLNPQSQIQNRKFSLLIFTNPVIWKEQVVLVMGAASRCDHLISRLKAAPTGVFYGNLDFPDKRLC